jgi:hypothetical protein
MCQQPSLTVKQTPFRSADAAADILIFVRFSLLDRPPEPVIGPAKPDSLAGDDA